MTIHDPHRDAIERMVEAERALAYLRDRIEALARSLEAESLAPLLRKEVAVQLWRIAGRLEKILEEDR